VVLESSRRSFSWTIPETNLNTSAGNLQTFTVDTMTGCVEDEVLEWGGVLGFIMGTFFKVSKRFFFGSDMCNPSAQLVELAVVYARSDTVNLIMCKLQSKHRTGDGCVTAGR